MKKLNYDGIIFDLDGTLWDSTGVNIKAWDRAYEELGYGESSVDEELFKSCMGLLLVDIGKKLHPELEGERLDNYVKKCISNSAEMLSKTGGVLYPGLEKTLYELSRNHKVCIVSNCQAGYIELFMDYHKVAQYITDTECPGNTGLLKCDNIKLICERNDFKNPVYIGDTQGDMDSAHKAGLPFIWASYGFGKNLSGYEYRINALEELLEMF